MKHNLSLFRGKLFAQLGAKFRMVFVSAGRGSLAVLPVILAGGLVAACAGGRGPAAGSATPVAQAPVPQPVAPLPEPQPVPPKIALLLPLSGQNGPLGQSMLQAAQMAVFDVAAEGFELVPEDTHQGGAGVAAQRAIQGGAQLILGPIFANEVQAVAAAARPRGIPVVSFSTDRTVAGNGVYVMGILPSLQIDRVVSYAGSQGVRRMAALLPASDYGRIVGEAIRESAGRNGLQIVATAQYQPGAPDPSAAIQQLSRNYEALIIPEGGQTLESLLPFLAAQGLLPASGSGGGAVAPLPGGGGAAIAGMAQPMLGGPASAAPAVKLLGSFLWHEAVPANEPALFGAWYPAPSPDNWQSFQRRFADNYGSPPPRLASMAYDATAMAAVLAGQPDGANFSPAALTQASGFAGVDGIFRLLPSGLVQRGLAILEVTPAGGQLRDPAPASFPATGF